MLFLVILARLLTLPLLRPLDDVLTRHAGAAAAAQGQEPADQHRGHEDDDDQRFQGVTTRISPSCAVLATSRPSRAKMLPRVNPRAPEALGLSVEYKSQSSRRALR